MTEATSVTAERLKSLEVTATDCDLVLQLSLPPDTDPERYSSDDLHDLCTAFYRFWVTLLDLDVAVPLDKWDFREGESELSLTGDDLRARLIFTAASYYCYWFRLLVRRPDGVIRKTGHPPLPAGLSFPEIYELVGLNARLFLKPPLRDMDPEKLRSSHFTDETLDSSRLAELQGGRTVLLLPNASAIFVEAQTFLVVLDILSGAHMAEHAPFAGLRALFQHKAMSCLRDLSDLRSLGPDNALVRPLIDMLLSAALFYADDVHRRTYLNFDTDWSDPPVHGPFSEIRVHELSKLARRAPGVCRRYGDTQIARLLEQQLALLFQSFGCHVVRTRTGRSTVDLVCISTLAQERATLLVEAKSSRGRYALPKRDARALVDYARDVSKSLQSLPPLSLVLLVGPDPARTVPSKIRDLQQEVKVPARYLPAGELARLRAALPGPFISKGIVAEFCECDSVITRDAIERIVSRQREVTKAHDEFVTSLLSEYR